MATYEKLILGSSTLGRGVSIGATATPGTLIHTASTSVGPLDEIWLWAMNTSTAAVKLTIQFGTTAVVDNIEITVPAESGLYQIVPGLILAGDAGGEEVRGFTAIASTVTIHGYVNRIS